MNNKKTRFKKLVRIDPKQLCWLRKQKDTLTIAGFLDKIINNYKRSITKISNKKGLFLGYYHVNPVYATGKKLIMLCNNGLWEDYMGSIKDLKPNKSTLR